MSAIIASVPDIRIRATHYLNLNSWNPVNKLSLPRESYKEIKHLAKLISL